ncbi:MAG: phage tail protein [Cyclobacteriaceae bacterium]
MADFELPVVFSFQLTISGITGDAAFKEASGLEMELTTEEVACGGENRFKYTLPGAMKFNNLVLKRGLITTDSGLTTWFTDLFSSGLNSLVKPKTIEVTLLDSKKKSQAKWSFVNAYPVKWKGADLDSMKSDLFIETIEFAYNYFETK